MPCALTRLARSNSSARLVTEIVELGDFRSAPLLPRACGNKTAMSSA